MQALLSSPETLDKAIIEADLVIGSVLVPGDQAPKLLTRDMLTRMRKGTVIVDICIDQGGFAESSRSTSIAEPTYIEDGVVHYCVPNMPALVPRTSTMALTAETIKWIELIAEKGVAGAIKSSNPLEKSLTTLKGNLTNQIIGKVLGIPSISKEESAALL
jgi:alanine dehydrogenase